MRGLIWCIGVFIAFPAWGCRCLEPTVADAYEAARLVALVRVDSTVPGPAGERVEARAVRAWKADIPRTITFLNDADCDFPLQSGDLYVLYFARGVDGTLSTGRCKGNRREPDAMVVLEWLHHHGRPSSVTATRAPSSALEARDATPRDPP